MPHTMLKIFLGRVSATWWETTSGSSSSLQPGQSQAFFTIAGSQCTYCTVQCKVHDWMTVKKERKIWQQFCCCCWNNIHIMAGWNVPVWLFRNFFFLLFFNIGSNLSTVPALEVTLGYFPCIPHLFQVMHSIDKQNITKYWSFQRLLFFFLGGGVQKVSFHYPRLVKKVSLHYPAWSRRWASIIPTWSRRWASIIPHLVQKVSLHYPSPGLEGEPPISLTWTRR